MKTELIRIGNSRGIRIPKPLIEQCGLGDEVDVRIQNDSIVISSPHRPRDGWEEAFRAAGPSRGDEHLLSGGTNEFDRTEWEW